MFQATAKFGCTLLQWKARKTLGMSTPAFFYSLYLYCVYTGSCVVGLVSTGRDGRQSGKLTKFASAQETAQRMLLWVLSPHLPTSDLPQTIVPCPLGQASRSALTAATGHQKDQHKRCGVLRQRNPLHKPEVHRGFKCECGPRLLFHVLTTLKRQVALTGFPNRLSAGNGEKPGHFSGAPPHAGQHYRGLKS